jgi:MYXO-CTERM domain-containing protein
MWKSGLAALTLLLVAKPAAAFTYETPASSGCHERITSDALRAVRAAGRAPSLPLTREEQAFADDVPFKVPSGLEDLGGITLLVGVRDNDLRGRGPTDMETVAQLHGDDAVQHEHCLRRAGQDGAVGSLAALAMCRAFIRDKVIAAIDALDSKGNPNPAARANITVTLAIRGQVTISLPAFYVRMGEALHTMQDSFTHTLRSDDGAEVKTILNWIEDVSGKLDEGRDGPPHLSPLDHCDDKDAIRLNRRTWATAASTELLQVALDSGRDRAAKINALDGVLDRWLGAKDGCNANNSWCNAPELGLRDEGCSCHAPGGSGDPRLAIGLAMVAVIALLRRRAIVLSVLLFAAPARAEDGDDAFKGANKPADPEGSVSKGTKDVLGRPHVGFGVQGAIGASFDSAAFNASIGARLRITDLWLTGLDVEWNPWGSPLDRVRPGALNIYAPLIKRWSMHSNTYALRSTLAVGTSTMLFDLYGAPRGTTGLYMGLSVIGLEVKLGPGVTMIFDPASFALPVPQLKGVFGYPQYRFQIALQWGAAGH